MRFRKTAPRRARKVLPTEADYQQLCGVGPDRQWAAGEIPTAREILSRVLDKLKLEERFRQAEIQALWPQIVGEFIARQSHPDSLRKGVLYIRVNNAAMKHHLQMMRRDLVEQMAARVAPGTVTDIRFMA